MKSPFFKKIIWPVDVIEAAEQQKNVLFVLGALARATDAAIQPVYVLSPPYAAVAAVPEADFEEAFRALAEKRLAEIPVQSGIPGMQRGMILTDRGGSLRRDVQCLLSYAAEQSADAIVIPTHARRGLSRLFVGSFAETLAVHSKIPVITVNPGTKVRERIEKILFPTNFDDRFRPAFEKAVEFAKALEARVTAYYKDPVIPGHLMSAELYAFITRENEARRAKAEEWKGWAANQGVQVETRVDDRPGYVVPALETLAEQENFDLLAIASQADAASALLMGSVARQMMRHSPCPVWVYKVEEKN